MRIVFYIGSFQIGGAERQLSFLIRGLLAKGHEIHVVTIHPEGGFAAEMKRLLGDKWISLYASEQDCLNQNLFARLWNIIRRFRKYIHRIQPDLVCSYAYYCYISGFLALLGKSIPQIWSIRCSNMAFTGTQKWQFTFSRLFSKHVDLLLANSKAGIDWHRKHHYQGEWKLVENGIDTDEFYPERSLGQGLRDRLQLTNDQLLIGMVSRLVTGKGFDEFLQAASIVIAQIPNAYFCIIGNGSDGEKTKLYKQANALGLTNYFSIVQSTEMLAAYNALDIYCLCSHSEGFSNVLGEAMACALPCIVTESGDSPTILNQRQWTIPIGNSDVLAEKLLQILSLSEDQKSMLGMANRRRIIENYSIEKMVSKMEMCCQTVLTSKKEAT